ncbi:MAG: ABC transporter permease [Pseudoflavonifractor sp.]|nr:ABC transporter permease [Pseudoflavonifractor sp.]
MFCKLARKNVVRSVRDYTLYFLTLLFGVCVFYVFNSLETQWVMEILAQGSGKMMVDAILQLMDVISVFVSVVLAFLILYANRFMLRRRKRELGIYLLLGMEQRKVALILFLETLIIGVLALAAGLVLGVLAAQFLSAFTAGLFAVTVEQFHFVFSWKGVVKTALYFGVIFLLVMGFNSFSVARQKLIRLLQAERQNEDLKLRSIPAAAAMFVVGVALIGTAYWMLFERGLLTLDPGFWLMLLLGSAGTLLFFRSLSGFLLRLCQNHKKLYYNGLNMFILRQFNSRITTNYWSMTVVCLMLLLAIGITACSVGLNNTVAGMVERDSPFDMTCQIWLDDNSVRLDLEQILTEAGFDVERDLPRRAQVSVCLLETAPGAEPPEDGESSSNVLAISQRDANTLLSLLGREETDLPQDGYGVLRGTSSKSEEQALRLKTERPDLALDGKTYHLEEAAWREDTVFTDGGVHGNILILPDAALEGRAPFKQMLVGDYPAGGSAEQTEERMQAAWERMSEVIGRHVKGGYGFGLSTRLVNYMDQMGTKLLVLFLGMYLGIIFLVTSAAVLALQQVSQAADNAGRYRILSRLGVEEKMQARSVDVQVFLSFFLPLSLAVVHSIVGMRAANKVIAQVGRLDVVASSTAAAVFILVVYGAYFLATCQASRRIVRER